ncbi:hypothetical protein [Streptomyces sp. NPDC001401]|uniref:hypothetical protein n=1 Tax=Streptomyces sp. NPDC001401 TaxID=3364570 RepID=UPI0036D0B107
MIDRAPASTALRSMLSSATGKPCGLGKLPLLDGKPAPLPYLVLYPQGGPVDGAPLADRAEDAHLRYQVTVVAARTDQAEWLADRVRCAVLDRRPTGEWEQPITPVDMDVWARELLVDEGIDPADSANGVVTCVQRYKLSVTA